MYICTGPLENGVRGRVLHQSMLYCANVLQAIGGDPRPSRRIEKPDQASPRARVQCKIYQRKNGKFKPNQSSNGQIPERPEWDTAGKGGIQNSSGRCSLKEPTDNECRSIGSYIVIEIRGSLGFSNNVILVPVRTSFGLRRRSGTTWNVST